MKYITVSGLGFLLVFPAFAGARLPAVNVSAGTVSAREQYGLTSTTSSKTQGGRPVSVVAARVADSVHPVTDKKRVVARGGNTPVVANGVDARAAAISDYLVPNRPSSDLWARVDTPLRMPHADEFSVLTSNDILPEEDLGPVSNFARNDDRNSEIAELSARTSALDSQLARLIDMQRRAEESVVARPQANLPSVETEITSTAPIAINPTREIATVAEKVPTRTIANNLENLDDGVKLSRLVVPRDESGEDVIVRATRKNTSAKIKEVRNDMKNMTPSELRRAFRKTFLSENKHLSTYPVDDRFDAVSDIDTSIEGFTSARDLSEDVERIRPLEIKIKFRDTDSALSRENYNLLSEYAGIVVSNPKRAIQIAIPEVATETTDSRKLAARRLAIVEQVLRDTGVSENRIVPILSQRDEEGFVLRVISNEQYETLTKQARNKYGRDSGTKKYKSLSW
ncbi:MAG: hypothetical protein J5714_03050 [Alphaproteobacteria bacterium]|nr:hypothetical protein [Alphaproteobacteria bacterium]